MIVEIVSSRASWDPTQQITIGGKKFLFFILLTNNINDYLLSICLKDSFKATMN